MKEPFRHRLVSRELLVGTLLTLPCPEVAEIAAGAGFDWLFIDLEHTTLGPDEAQRMMHAAPHVPCVVRCPSSEEVWIKKCLDAGPDGIMIPQIRSRQQAEQTVRFAKYPPLGERGVGVARAQGYGFDFQRYLQRANDTVALILQVEHIDAVRDIDAILRVEGIDCIFVGPYDLSGSMGRIGQISDPEVVGAIGATRDACRAAGVALGIFGMTAESVRPYIERGFTLITVGIDATLLGSAARQIVSDLKP